jgi:hypothetical protein
MVIISASSSLVRREKFLKAGDAQCLREVLLEAVSITLKSSTLAFPEMDEPRAMQ